MPQLSEKHLLYKLLATARDEVLNFAFNWTPVELLRRLFLVSVVKNGGFHVAVARGVCLKKPENIQFTGRAVINSGCILDARGGAICIGDDVDIGRDTHIWTLQHDINNDNHGTNGSGIEIDDHAWIATRVTILPGVKIGRGAVVGAGSVVTKDVGELDVVAGNPAKMIGKRKNSLKYRLTYRFYF